MAPINTLTLLILTFIAYRRGWHGWALLPVGGLTFVILLMIFIPGIMIQIRSASIVFLNWVAAVPLVIMIIKKRY